MIVGGGGCGLGAVGCEARVAEFTAGYSRGEIWLLYEVVRAYTLAVAVIRLKAYSENTYFPFTFLGAMKLKSGKMRVLTYQT